MSQYKATVEERCLHLTISSVVGGELDSFRHPVLSHHVLAAASKLLFPVVPPDPMIPCLEILYCPPTSWTHPPGAPAGCFQPELRVGQAEPHSDSTASLQLVLTGLADEP